MRSLLIKLVFQIIELVTPEIRQTLCEALVELKEKAKNTSNQWDDILVELLIAIFDCDKK